MGYYRGKKVLVVGGSKGIGRALAEHLAREGAAVVVAARGQAALDETVAALEATGGPGPFGSQSFDVTDMDAVASAVEAVLETLGGLDVLVCNSGYATAELFEHADVADFRRMMDVNFFGHVHVCKAVVPHLIAQGRGDICLVSSMMGFLPLFGYSAYAASKFAISGFAESLRQEMKTHGVRVTAYFPPTTETPGLEKENETKPPAVWALEAESGWNKVYTAEQVALSMARCIEKGVVHGMIGNDSRLLYTVNRLAPGLTRYLTDGEVRSAIAKAGSGEGTGKAGPAAE
jgi:3-dehydrosphinganine reductase